MHMQNLFLTVGKLQWANTSCCIGPCTSYRIRFLHGKEIAAFQ